MKHKINKTIAIAIVVLILSVGANFALGSSEKDTPYYGGWRHGCDDAKISDPHDRYISGDGKGEDSHTSEFMRGYSDGFDSCGEVPRGDEYGYSTTPASSNSAEAFFNQPPQYQEGDGGNAIVAVSSNNNHHHNSDDGESKHTICAGWSNGQVSCGVDGRVSVFNNSPTNHVDTLTQAQSQTQHVTCITIFSVCGNNNQQGQVASTSLDP